MTDLPGDDPAVERVLRICKANWEYRGVDPVLVEDMLTELRAHLADARADSREPAQVVGTDPRAFARTWAAAREPRGRRLARLATDGLAAVGLLLPAYHLLAWTTVLSLTSSRLIYLAVVAAVVVAVELRRGGLGLFQTWLLGGVVGIPVVLLVNLVLPERTIVSVPLWLSAALGLVALAYVIRLSRRLAAVRAGSAREDGPGQAGPGDGRSSGRGQPVSPL
ncbi:MAG TPA: hypothetical protein VES42_13025 [Pilimelia sp.]|nr:hypothetical protein [Pilimelia sp.]